MLLLWAIKAIIYIKRHACNEMHLGFTICNCLLFLEKSGLKCWKKAYIISHLWYIKLSKQLLAPLILKNVFNMTNSLIALFRKPICCLHYVICWIFSISFRLLPNKRDTSDLCGLKYLINFDPFSDLFEWILINAGDGNKIAFLHLVTRPILFINPQLDEHLQKTTRYNSRRVMGWGKKHLFKEWLNWADGSWVVWSDPLLWVF